MSTLFDRWAEVNMVTCPWRYRFEELKEKLNKCTTKQEAEKAVFEEGYSIRYPLLPEELK
jgi:hypothetical protein